MPPADATPAPAARSPDPHVARWIRRQIAGAPLKAPSLIVTVWGDAIAPHGGAALLPGLIRLLEPFGINERSVRTSVYRLGREGWLESTPVGRQSLYRLRAEGERRFEQAFRRIYSPPSAAWDDSWEVALADGLPAHKRRTLQQELLWEGFGTLGPGVFVRPAQAPSALPRIVAALGVGSRVVAVRARDDDALGARPLAATVAQAWDLADVALGHRRFLREFGAVIERFRERDPATHDPEQCFVVRTLLIHAYRRVLLRDPQLPAALLPLDWPGAAAFTLCRDFYRLTHRAAERHLQGTLRNARGPLPPAVPAFYARFGGLPR
jgi:phenylacetic acid degradation operon negative regulatory protein